MRIECPGCEAAYEVPDAQIRPGRNVRCARCAVQWRPAGALPEAIMAKAPIQPLHDEAAGHSLPAIEDQPVRDGVVRLRQSGVAAPTAPEHEPVALGAAAAVRKLASWRPAGRTLASRSLASWTLAPWTLAWLASLVLLSGLLASATHWRMTIMQDWPPSIRLYTMLGATPPQT